MSFLKKGIYGGLIVLFVLYTPLFYRFLTRDPPLNPPSKYRIINDFFTPKLQKELISIFQDSSPFVTAIDDQTALFPHIGEAVPIQSNGKCPESSPYLVPNINRTHCQLVTRMDIGRHQILTGIHVHYLIHVSFVDNNEYCLGGYEGSKSFFDTMATR